MMGIAPKLGIMAIPFLICANKRPGLLRNTALRSTRFNLEILKCFRR